MTVAFIFAGIFSAQTQSEEKELFLEEEGGLLESYSLGDAVEPFALTRSDGEVHSLEGELGEKVIALYFWNFKRPYIEDYEAHLSEVISKFQGNGENVLEEGVLEEEDVFDQSNRSASDQGVGEWFGLGAGNGNALIWVIDSNADNNDAEI